MANKSLANTHVKLSNSAKDLEEKLLQYRVQMAAEGLSYM